MIDTIIFDLGGTLIEYAGPFDSWPELERPGLLAAFNILSQTNIALPNYTEFETTAFQILPQRWQQATRGEKNLTIPSFLIDILANLNIPKKLVVRATTAYEQAICAQATLINNAPALLATLKNDGYKIGLISNTMFSPAAHLQDLQRFDLDHYFSSTLFSSAENKWKPQPQTFHTILNNLNSAPETTIFVGDDPAADIVGAHSAGLHSILYRSSNRFPLLPNVQPLATITDLIDLLTHIPKKRLL